MSRYVPSVTDDTFGEAWARARADGLGAPTRPSAKQQRSSAWYCRAADIDGGVIESLSSATPLTAG